MRRGELLVLRWRDIDLDTGTISIRRSAGVVRNKGRGAVITEGQTKTNRPRVIDIAPGDVALLRAWKRDRGSLALALALDDALVFGDLEGRHLHPERFSRTFKNTLKRCRKDLGDDAPPEIRLHDTRHTMATLWQVSAGVDLRDVQIAARHADRRTTMRYDRARKNLDRHPNYILAAYMASGT
jgi:integrase